MRRSKRQHSPAEEWVEDGYGSQRKEEAQTTKRPRRSSPVEEAELKDTCPRKNHHGKTYERCRQNTNRPHQALQSKAREPRRGVGASDRTRAMGTLIRTSNGKDEVVSTLGEGAFGKVVECLDRNKSERVALKIVKNIERYREAAQSEIAVLGEINSLDDDHTFACVRMLDWFDHHGHICIVFELLGLSTFDYLRENDFLPFTVEHIRHMAFQIFRAVCFLHRNKVTHTDLKPENILFVRSDYDMEYNDRLKRDQRTLKSLDVKVVDFGNATFDRDHHPSLVSTRHYRAPEVILDLGWNQACDVWSLGCILMEYYLGLTVFQTHDSKEHLAMMERVLGPIPPSLLSKTRKRHFVERERLDWDEHSSSGRYVRKHCKPLKQYMQSRSAEHQQLFELIGSMLEYDVSRRITMEEALWHPFFTPLRMVRCP
ncbi:dual specificity protein kinase CLK4 isoform X4 [Gadus morhua]|uniref:dual specificity protein kinase CLK4 isoform X4 n=1 Tax=Gadus morhua TaxID=8049 RepID=UPI0011B3FBA1|nr:dual specificity protein kinase CLK4-like isoform X4 [Gadus morhua]